MKPACPMREPTSCLRDEAGFALPFTIFLVTIITIMLAAAFTRATADHQVASNSATEVSALAIAQSGLQSFLEAGDTMTTRPAPTDSFRFNVTGGYAWVYPDLIFQPADTLLGFTYVVRSVGNVIHPNVGPDPQATRTIAQFARWNSVQLPALAALVALNGIDHENVPSHVNPTQTMWFDGDDDVACTSPAAAPLGYRGPLGSEDPGTHTDPSSMPLAYDMTGTPQDIADELGIDWTAATTDSILNPDYTTLNSTPGFLTFLIDGDLTLDTSGEGLLVVTGDLTLVDDDVITWDGLILVGGQIIPVPSTSSDYTLVHGMVVTGLNLLDGTAVDPNPMQGESPALQIQYCSCSVRRALERFAGFQTIDNTWIDNWATY